MIGLGSNRLSVCRRGGMRVTQAGKGGMEWLAGGRMPSWATPYSVQATAALVAQFPTQWPTILDYGFAHPALVPFINEDPMLVMSLIEGLGVRKIIGDGIAYLFTNTYINDRWRFVADIKLANDNANVWFEGMNCNTESYFLIGAIGTQAYVYLVSSSSGGQPHPTINKNTYYIYELDGKNKKFILNGTSYDMVGTTTGVTMAYPFGLFGSNKGTEPDNRPFKGERTFANFYDENGLLKAQWVPCKHNNENGMLDIITAHWEGNANIVNGVKQGSFTISETPAA